MNFSKTLTNLFLFVGLISCSNLSNSGVGNTDEIFKNLPKGEIEFEEMTHISPHVNEETIIKMLESKVTNENWLKSHIIENKNNVKNGEIPYHPNFGITEVEYNEYLKDSKKLKLIKVGEGRITVEENEGEISFFTNQNEYKVYNQLKINLDDMSIKWADLEIVGYSKINANEKQLAKFNGYSWEYKSAKSLEELYRDSKYFHFNIGKLVEEDGFLLRLTVMIFEDSKVTVDEERVIKLLNE